MYNSKCLVIIFILVTQVQVVMDADLVLIIKKCYKDFPYRIALKKNHLLTRENSNVCIHYNHIVI
jgi:hypothetical protein